MFPKLSVKGQPNDMVRCSQILLLLLLLLHFQKELTLQVCYPSQGSVLGIGCVSEVRLLGGGRGGEADVLTHRSVSAHGRVSGKIV